MVTKVKYNNFLSIKGDIITVTNDIGQEWELKRKGISEDELKKFLKETDKTEGIKSLISDGRLVPIYGGNLNI